MAYDKQTWDKHIWALGQEVLEERLNHMETGIKEASEQPGGSVDFANIGGEPTDNTKLAIALNAKQDTLPTIINDKYLHTNASTGALEWSTVSGGGEPSAYLKSASVSSNVLTLTNKDATTVTYEPTGFVDTTTAQTITGAKTFNNTVNINTTNNYLLKALDTASSTTADWKGTALIGADNRNIFVGAYKGLSVIGAKKWTSAAAGTDEEWDNLYINPDGDSNAVYIGKNDYTAGSGILLISNDAGKVYINKGTTTTPTWKEVVATDEKVKLTAATSMWLNESICRQIGSNTLIVYLYFRCNNAAVAETALFTLPSGYSTWKGDGYVCKASDSTLSRVVCDSGSISVARGATAIEANAQYNGMLVIVAP